MDLPSFAVSSLLHCVKELCCPLQVVLSKALGQYVGQRRQNWDSAHVIVSVWHRNVGFLCLHNTGKGYVVFTGNRQNEAMSYCQFSVLSQMVKLFKEFVPHLRNTFPYTTASLEIVTFLQ